MLFDMPGRLAPLRRSRVYILCGALVVSAGAWAVTPRVLANDKIAAVKDAGDNKPRGHRRHRENLAAETSRATSSPDQDAKAVTDAEEPVTPQPARAASIDFTAKLEGAGASTCRAEINTLAAATLGKTEQYNTVLNWADVGGDRRPVSLAIGQKYAAGSKVPYSLSQIFSAPNGQGRCDGFTMEVYPSPLPCERLRQAMIEQDSRQVGDLAGIVLLQNKVGGRTMLLSTSTNTCVMVATRSFYAR